MKMEFGSHFELKKPVARTDVKKHLNLKMHGPYEFGPDEGADEYTSITSILDENDHQIKALLKAHKIGYAAKKTMQWLTNGSVTNRLEAGKIIRDAKTDTVEKLQSDLKHKTRTPTAFLEASTNPLFKISLTDPQGANFPERLLGNGDNFRSLAKVLGTPEKAKAFIKLVLAQEQQTMMNESLKRGGWLENQNHTWEKETINPFGTLTIRARRLPNSYQTAMAIAQDTLDFYEAKGSPWLW